MAENKKYLIGIGTNKAGTTSLFNYLGDHPKITPSVSKQLNYFFDAETTAIEAQGKWERPYNEAFKTDRQSEYLLDISPDYMYDLNVAERINKELGSNNVYILCILRDPVDRFKSWFNYSKQNGHLQEDIRFNEFISKQDESQATKSPFAALKTGKYLTFLHPFIQHFPHFKVIFTEDLKSKPKEILEEITTWLNIDNDIYKDYTFNTYNKTVKVKNKGLEKIYLGIHGWVKRGLINLPFFFNLFKPFGKYFSAVMKRKNSQSLDNQELDDKSLKKAYIQSVTDLEKELKLKTPWKRFHHV